MTKLVERLEELYRFGQRAYVQFGVSVGCIHEPKMLKVGS